VVADQYYKLSLAAELSVAVAFASCMRALLWLASSLHFEFQTASAFRSVTQRSPPLPGSHCKATPGGALARATHTPVCLLALPLFSSLQSATTARAPPGLGLLLVLCSWRTAPSLCSLWRPISLRLLLLPVVLAEAGRRTWEGPGSGSSPS
jgi:hypothetical protein